MDVGIALDDDVLLGERFEFGDQIALARLQRFGDFRVDAQREDVAINSFGHLARFRQDFVAGGIDGPHPTGTGAILKRLG